MSQNKISSLISHIVTAVSSCSLYSRAHPVVEEFTEKAVGLIDGLFLNDSLSFFLLGASLIINDMPFSEKGIHINNFKKRMKKKKIEKIVIKKGVDLDEFRNFISAMASSDTIASSPHIAVGIVEVKLGESGIDASALLNAGIEKVKDAYSQVSRFKSLDMVSLEDAVIDFIATLKKELNVLRIVSPVKSHNEYTFVHATNVSVLTLFQAESLGLKGEKLHNIGLAGLLHDCGKLFVSTAVLDKQAKLDAGEWVEMKNHPVLGAMYLSKLTDVPPLASIVAFEHHMKFDGSGYPETKKSGKKQHIVSQMVAIADFFDALRTERPYRKALDVPTITGMMKEGSGKDFNPLLVENFLSSLKKVTDVI
ncbi:MAG: HD domain-containing protein [Nitrospirae bacterium]|nr:HD domain-containing protein [Nitrospirota bacterium]